MVTETEIYTEDGKEVMRTEITRPLNNFELEKKIYEMGEILKKVIVAVGEETRFEYTGSLISKIEKLQANLK